MQFDQDDKEFISIGAIEVNLLLPEAEARGIENALLDEDYLAIYRQLGPGGNAVKYYGIKAKWLCWKNRI